MKKGLLLVLAILFVFCCAGCSGPAVSETQKPIADASPSASYEGETKYLEWKASDWENATQSEKDDCSIAAGKYYMQTKGIDYSEYTEDFWDSQIKIFGEYIQTALSDLESADTVKEAIDFMVNLEDDLDNDDQEDNTSSSSGTNPYGYGNLPYYEAGQYKVGTDMDAGEYILVVTTDVMGYFCVSSDANKDDILFNDMFDTNSIITVKDGEYVELSRCIAMPLEEFHKNYAVSKEASGVMFKVGVDIEAGEYKVTAEEGETGYYCVYGDSRHDDIIANDNFEGSAYVKVKDGQYLVLVRCLLAE